MSQPANDDFSQHLSDDEASYHEDASDNGTATNKPKQQQQLIPTTTTISNIKLPILKKEEYDIWAMEMEHYLEYIDNDVWKVIQNGNSKKRISIGKDGVVRILPPVSAAEIHAVEKERKARTILLMAIPKEHLRRFHGMDDAKEIWEAIRTRFGGNANSKKMQKVVLKQQFEAFTISSSEGLEKGYDRFQQLLSQLETHGAEVSIENANPQVLRSFALKEPSSKVHLIRDYDFYEKKMAREAELKKQRVFNTGNRVPKPVWNNANRDQPLKNMEDREKPNVKGVGYRWMFDIDYLTDSMNYILVSLENQTNPHAGTSEVTNSAGTLQTPNANVSEEEDEAEELIVVPTALKHTAAKVRPRKSSTNSKAEEFLTELQNLTAQEKEAYSTGISEDTPEILAFRRELDELAQKHLREVPKNKATSTNSVNSGSGQENTQPADQDDSDMPELTIFNKPQKGIFDEASYDDEGMVHDFNNLPTEVPVSPIPTLRIHNIHPQSQILGDPKSSVQTRSRVQQHSGAHALEEPKKISKALKDDSWVKDHPLKNKKDKKDIMLVQVYVDDIIFGSTRKSWCDEFEALMKGRFQMSSMGELIFFLRLQVKQKTDGLFISQDKYVAEILKKFDLASVKTAITPMETKMALTKDEEADDVDVHLYRSMIGSLMYLTASRPDIIFTVCACSRFQVTPKTSHLNVVKRIFKYLKGKPNLGLWYPLESPFDLEDYSDSDYARANLDRKSTTGGYQFLGRRLISWQCKKQTIVATSTTEAEYVAAASCCGQVLWIQNQMMDYGFNFMNTKIHIDNESIICIVKNLVYYSKTKHIEIRHHFIRDSFEKKLIRVEKINTDFDVADLLTKALYGPRIYLDCKKNGAWIKVELKLCKS
ncbi:putative ribonuclease H-like domain-containing protein [Tanacetum coccineum]